MALANVESLDNLPDPASISQGYLHYGQIARVNDLVEDSFQFRVG